jgi:hypothetical protein
MLTKEVQSPGRWEVSLRTDTPETVRRGIVERGHVMFFDQALDPRRFTDADLKSLSIYSGRLLRMTTGQGGVTPMRLSGDHLMAWLGDSDGRGQIITITKSYTTEPWNTFISDILPTSLSVGTVTATPGNVDGDFFAVTPKVAIDEAASLLAAEYRVNDDGTFDSGVQSDLYVTSPIALVVRRDASFDVVRDHTTTDIDVRAYGSTQLESSVDAADWVSEVHMAGQGDFAGGGEDILMGSADLADISESNPYKDFLGNADVTAQVLNDPIAFISQADAKAQVALTARAVLTQQITLNLDDFDISGSFKVGDTIFCYDPPETADATNEVEHDGRYIYPAAIRVFGISTPVKQGMGVVYRTATGTYIDLTPYVSWESGSAQITIGDRYRSPFDSMSQTLTALSQSSVMVPNAITTPGVPTNDTPWLSSAYQDNEGKTWSKIQVKWTEPLNTDSSVISDGDHYVVKYRKL